MQLFWIIPLLIVIGFVVSLLGSISGVGGGVLFVPLLTVLSPFLNNGQAFSFHQIKFVSTLLIFVSSIFNAFSAFRHGQVNWQMALFTAIFSVPLVYLGNYVADLLNAKWTSMVVIIILVIITFLLAFNEYLKKIVKPNPNPVIKHKWMYFVPRNQTKINVFAMFFAVLGGCFVASLTGMGGGPLIMPIMVLVCGLTFKGAAPISHLIILFTSGINICFNYQYFGDSHLNLVTTLPMVVGVVMRTFFTVHIRKFITKEWIIKWILIALICASIIKMIIDWVRKY